MRGLRGVALASVVGAVLLGGCAPPSPSQSSVSSSEPSTPKRITAAVRGDPRTLSDAINFAAGLSSVAGVRELEQLVNSGLGLIDDKGQVLGQLAETAPSIENGLWKLLPDGRMETTWKIRPSAQWHDGAAVTAEDVVFTARVAQDRSLSMSQDAAFRFVDSVEALDSHTVLVRWKSAYIDADKLFTQARGSRMLPLPRHILEQGYLEDKATFTELPFWTQGYVGSGPYKLRDWVLGSHLVLEANDRYVLGRPKIDQIDVRIILDTNTIVSNVLAGAVDLTLGRGLNVEQAILMRDQWKDGVVDAGLQNTTALYPQFLNPNPPILTDARFRRALFHAIDRQQIVDTFLASFVPVAHSMISPDEPEYRDIEASIVRYNQDPRQAIEIIQGLGFARAADGFFRDGSNQRLSVEVRTRAHDLREKLQQVIADDWSRVGIVAEAVVVPEQRISDRVYQATYPGFYFRFGSPEIASFHSARTPVPENNFVGNNQTRYHSPELDALIDRYFVTIPRPERVQVLAQVVRHLTEQLNPMPLFHEPEPVMISKRLVSAGGRRGDGVQAWNAHEWDVR